MIFSNHSRRMFGDSPGQTCPRQLLKQLRTEFDEWIISVDVLPCGDGNIYAVLAARCIIITNATVLF